MHEDEQKDFDRIAKEAQRIGAAVGTIQSFGARDIVTSCEELRRLLHETARFSEGNFNQTATAAVHDNDEVQESLQMGLELINDILISSTGAEDPGPAYRLYLGVELVQYNLERVRWRIEGGRGEHAQKSGHGSPNFD